jgi:hypothetical protein
LDESKDGAGRARAFFLGRAFGISAGLGFGGSSWSWVARKITPMDPPLLLEGALDGVTAV